MPIYEYRCESCGARGEHLRKLNDPHTEPCPKCGKTTYQRQISASNLQFKGSGFYETDFKNKPQAAPPCQTGEGSCATCPSAAATS